VTMQSDVVIVGGGIAGSALALVLARRDASVMSVITNSEGEPPPF
jgi:flavin-dependent dehydrogenase